jgi:hypothetical protein
MLCWVHTFWVAYLPQRPFGPSTLVPITLEWKTSKPPLDITPDGDRQVDEGDITNRAPRTRSSHSPHRLSRSVGKKPALPMSFTINPHGSITPLFHLVTFQQSIESRGTINLA